jgi:hypothetical protein
VIEGASEVSSVDFVDLRLLHDLQQNGFFKPLAAEQPAR